MILPIILSYNYLNNSSKKLDGLWAFYKFLDFAKKNDGYIIGREIYFENPKKYNSTWDLNRQTLKMYDYEYPSIELLEKNKKFMISNEIENYFEKKNITLDYLLKKNDVKLEKSLLESLAKIEEASKKKVDIIITWYPLYTIKKICKKKKIKLIYEEFSTFRKEWYNYTLGTISLNSKYLAQNDYKKYQLLNFSNKIILTREELIIMFSYKKDVEQNLKYLKSKPIYEIGYALGLNRDPYEIAYCRYQKDDVMQKLLNDKIVKKVLIRMHPQAVTKVSKKFNIDNSKSSREFISKCDKMLINVSNLGFESMLYGRKVVNLYNGFITSFGEEDDLNIFNDKVISLEKLNFIVFALYTPLFKMFDYNYIKNIAKSHFSINEIYTQNQHHIFQYFHIDQNKLIGQSTEKRKYYLLKTIHKFSDREIKKILNITYNDNEKKEKNNIIKEITILKEKYASIIQKNETLEKEYLNIKYSNEELNNLVLEKEKNIEYLKRDLNILSKNYYNIINSKSWRYTQIIRNISNIIRRKKQ